MVGPGGADGRGRDDLHIFDCAEFAAGDGRKVADVSVRAKIGEQDVDLGSLASDPASDGFSSHLNQARRLDKVEKSGVCGDDFPIRVNDDKSLRDGLDEAQNIGVVVRRRPCRLAEPRKQNDKMGSAILTIKRTRQQDASLVAFELNMDVIDTRRHSSRGKKDCETCLLPSLTRDSNARPISFFGSIPRKVRAAGFASMILEVFESTISTASEES